ncbi:MAG: NB-ARC domain-containing protein [Solibacillus sp.]
MKININGYKKIFYLENILREYCNKYSKIQDLEQNLLTSLNAMAEGKGEATDDYSVLLSFSHIGQLYDFIKSKKFQILKENNVKSIDITQLINKRNDIMHSRSISDDEVEFIGDKCSLLIENLYDEEFSVKWNKFITIEIKDFKVPFPHIVYPMGKNFKYLVGRTSELKELVKTLEFPMPISIVGHGGLGKTALVQQLIEDLIYDYNTPFENIYFMSFKNTAFEKGQISRFEKAIGNHRDLILKLAGFMNIDETKPFSEVEELVWKDMFDKKSLLILDNLETEIVKSNLQEFTDIAQKFISHYMYPSRLIITSRYGLGDREAKLPLKQFEIEDTKKLILQNLNSQQDIKSIQEEDWIWAQNYTHGNPGLIISLGHTLKSSTKTFKDLRIEFNSAYTSESRQLHDQYEEFLNFCFEHTIESMSNESQQFLAALCYICSQTNLTEINEEFLTYLRDELGFNELGEPHLQSLLFTNIGFLQSVSSSDKYYINELFINYLDGSYSDKVYNVFDLQKSKWDKKLSDTARFINQSQLEHEKSINAILAELYHLKYKTTKNNKYIIKAFFCEPNINILIDIYSSFKNSNEIYEKINFLGKVESQLKNTKFIKQQHRLLKILIDALSDINRKIMNYDIIRIRQSDLKNAYYEIEKKIPLLSSNKLEKRTGNSACKLLIYFKDYTRVKKLTFERLDLINNLFSMHSKQVGDLSGTNKAKCLESIEKCKELLLTHKKYIQEYEKAQFLIYSSRYYKTENPEEAIRITSEYESYFLLLKEPQFKHILFYLESMLNQIESMLNSNEHLDNIQHVQNKFTTVFNKQKKNPMFKQERKVKMEENSRKLNSRYNKLLQSQ